MANRPLDEDSDIRTAIFPGSNEGLAGALAKIGELPGERGRSLRRLRRLAAHARLRRS
jgi:hypothetical protein